VLALFAGGILGVHFEAEARMVAEVIEWSMILGG
jgi:hypothetical protein